MLQATGLRHSANPSQHLTMSHLAQTSRPIPVAGCQLAISTLVLGTPANALGVCLCKEDTVTSHTRVMLKLV